MSIAVLFGLNYPGTSSALRGCANDVDNMAAYLKGKYGTIRKYKDIDPATRQYTTKSGMVRTLKSLAREARNKRLSSVFIHYSGHGSYTRDRSGDEADGRDEALVPSDYRRAGLILDDELNSILTQFPSYTKVRIVMDCCHSGTIVDLPFNRVNPTSAITNTKKGKIRANCVMLSGCLDSQTSADAYIHRSFSGALTTSLLEALRS